jgi:predicted RNA-binding Zn-ribbon protein involved in translation (DUF1610 family)
MAEHEYTSAPTCPHCGHQDRNAFEINFGAGMDGETTHTCPSCGVDFFLQRHVDVSYSSFPLASPAEAAHG